MSIFGTLINAAKQIRGNTVSYDLLSTALQGNITQITTNKTDIAAIVASKGVANGIAVLDGTQKIPLANLPSIALSDFLGEVADTTAMYALDGQRGDWATVVPAGHPEQSQSYMRIGEGNTAADWRNISTPMDGVSSLRNTSGSVTGINGVATLADVAFSGAATDVAFSNASYTATNTSGALIEAMGKITAVENEVNTINTDIADKVSVTKMKFGVNLQGTIDGVNKVFTSTENVVLGSVQLYFGGQALRPTIDYTITGKNTFTIMASPDFESERPFISYIAE